MERAIISVILLSFSILCYGQPLQKDTLKPTVYIFMLEECVICQNYCPKINTIYEDYHDKFNFLLVFPSFISKPSTIEKFYKDYNIKIPYKTDFYKTLVNKFDVNVTPEVVIYDPKQESVLYKGRLDNSFFALGKRRKSGISTDLVIAIEQILSGQSPRPSSTQAIGCIINRDELEDKR
ncbi:MAG TPA: thioredoxin-like domain-containing protein [Saprospiraceae bacterium]|nr:thioredoxin-like domain-containing protein [Saprospiraceae bacterium]